MSNENPKDIAAQREQRVRLSLIPPAAANALARALMNGADKYGAWNWRTQGTIAVSLYVDAMRRHLDAFMDREDDAPDSGVHHLGHVMAGAAIVLDAIAHGRVEDDRPVRRAPTPEGYEAETVKYPNGETEVFNVRPLRTYQVPPQEPMWREEADGSMTNLSAYTSNGMPKKRP